MLMIGTDELASRLYEEWRVCMDKVQPVTSSFGGSVRPRVRYDKLEAYQQRIWRDVAGVAMKTLADAIESA